jgi:CTP synthase (UTP-ammonia lyase)
MSAPTLALVGDYSPEVVAHRAIPRALELACIAIKCDLSWQWVATRDLHDAPRDLAKFSAVWVVPASPYENMAGALDAIRYARERKKPFLGTCGGFQHALIEFARHVAGLAAADHAETKPMAPILVVTPLSCSMIEKSGSLRFVPGSLIRAAYGRDTAHEGYHCNYGLNPGHRAALERAGLRFTAFDENNAVRAAELPASAHPFFVGTLFQPERAALRGELPPLVAAFVRATAGQVAPV